MKKLALAILSLASTCELLADQYHVELEAAYVDGELLESIDYDGYVGTITGYLNFTSDESGVSLDEGPYAEASFLSRASSLSVGRIELDVDDTDEESNLVDIHLVLESGTILELATASIEDSDVYSFAIGSYWGENISTLLRLRKTTTTADSQGGADPDPFAVELDTHGYIPVGDNSMSYDLTVGWRTQETLEDDKSDTEFNGIIGGRATYFIGRKLGVGLAADWTSVENADVYSYSANAEIFVTPRLGVRVDYLLQESGGGIGKTDEAVTISLKGRL